VIARGIAGRIALAAIASAAVGLVILAGGVAVVGADVFTELMMEAGDTADHAREMYDDSVTTVVIAASLIAVAASIVLAVVLARMLARPIDEVGAAARRIADGDYAARVPREGPEELASLADSFNQMAASLERQEQVRRDFIANAAHELRTPLTNLQGYLEALRDGVIVADRATYESLHEEADRLVRLSRSLDALAEGDAGSTPPTLVEVDLATLLGSAIELASPSMERAGLRLEVEVPTGLTARADPDRLA
jgi:two-component system sensor histidine kinase BaeS